jgi:hypothetical protein
MPEPTITSLAQDIGVNLLVSVAVFAVGCLIGRWRLRRQLQGRNLEQADFYPFVTDATAAAQRIVIAEQNGARRFKCTTAPILREPHGIVGAVCMNIDINDIRDHVLASREATEESFRHDCETDTWLDEDILSRPECERALAGRRHWRDTSAAR